MERSEIFEKLKEVMRYIIKNADEALKNVTEESNLYTDLGLNSVGMLYSVIVIEETFGVTIQGVDVGEFQTVSDIVGYIEKAQAQ